MKNWLLVICFSLSTLTLQAQSTFGNEWIRTSQKYLKFSVAQTGVYRVSYQDIQAADASFLQTNPTNWQLFFRGREIAIRVVGEKDGVFNSQDYVEFYGEGNDGSQDSLLYRPQKRLHPYQTLFSDTTAYFLTNGATSVGKRVPELNNSAQGLSPVKFHIQETVQAYTSQFTFNNLLGVEPFLQQSYYEPGEGWSGPLLTLDSVGVVSMRLTGRVTNDWPITLESMVNGRDNTLHQVQVTQNASTTPMTTLTFSGFVSQTFQSIISPGSLQNEQLVLRFKAIKNSTINNFSITYARITYPQLTDMTGLTSKVFRLVPNTGSTSLLAITNAPANALAYDITDKANCRFITAQTSSDQTQLVVSEANQSRTLFVTSQISKPKIKAVHFSSNFPKATDYVIITHSSLRQSATTYAAYRASSQGGSIHRLLLRPIRCTTNSIMEKEAHWRYVGLLISCGPIRLSNTCFWLGGQIAIRIILKRLPMI
ncbi:hypothetical protein LN737_15685 [Spirosoma sp. KNUC1025]|nr:hypothetical protein LN737_15685 [Spirosoma sp. KNUC1025]